MQKKAFVTEDPHLLLMQEAISKHGDNAMAVQEIKADDPFQVFCSDGRFCRNDECQYRHDCRFGSQCPSLYHPVMSTEGCQFVHEKQVRASKFNLCQDGQFCSDLKCKSRHRCTVAETCQNPTCILYHDNRQVLTTGERVCHGAKKRCMCVYSHYKRTVGSTLRLCPKYLENCHGECGTGDWHPMQHNRCREIADCKGCASGKPDEHDALCINNCRMCYLSKKYFQ